MANQVQLIYARAVATCFIIMTGLVLLAIHLLGKDIEKISRGIDFASGERQFELLAQSVDQFLSAVKFSISFMMVLLLIGSILLVLVSFWRQELRLHTAAVLLIWILFLMGSFVFRAVS